MNLRAAGHAFVDALADLLEPKSTTPTNKYVDITDEQANPAGYRQVHDAAERDEIRVHCIGRRRLVLRDELDAWIASRPTIAEAKAEAEAKGKTQQPKPHALKLLEAAGYKKSAAR
jgi:hypothetical protein